jgi:signal peptidase I
VAAIVRRAQGRGTPVGGPELGQEGLLAGVGSFQAAGECINCESGGSNSVADRSYASGTPSAEGVPADSRGVRPRHGAPAWFTTYTAGLVTRRPALGCLLEIVETLVLTLIIFFVIQTFVAQPYQIRQQSMETTLEPDQYVLVDKLTPRFDTYKRGDIVVFAPPESWAQPDGTPYIKRVIGVGGDKVEIRDGSVFVNDTELVEPYVFVENGQPQETEDPLQLGEWVVPDGDLFLMGDHRKSSADSREFGTVRVDQVIGRAWLRYWPLDTLQILQTPTHPELLTSTP